jgi:hypothetical protein
MGRGASFEPKSFLALAGEGRCDQWRMLPKDFPPYSTVQSYFYRWRADGTLWKINHALVMAARQREGRDASPSAGIIDSQSVKPSPSSISPRSGSCSESYAIPCDLSGQTPSSKPSCANHPNTLETNHGPVTELPPHRVSHKRGALHILDSHLFLL